MRVFFIAVCAVMFANSSVYAYLGGFEADDGYQNVATVPTNFTLFPDFDVAKYNAGEYGANSGPDAAYTPGFGGLWTKLQGPLMPSGQYPGFGEWVYATSHVSSPSVGVIPHSGARALVITTNNNHRSDPPGTPWTGPPQEYAYSIDSFDLRGFNPAFTDKSIIKMSYWSCAQLFGIGEGGGVPAGAIGDTVSFYDGPGPLAKLGLQLGYIQPTLTPNAAGIIPDYAAFRVGGVNNGNWTNTGIEVDPHGWHRWDVTLDLAAKRVSVDLFDPGPITSHTAPVNIVPATTLIDPTMSGLRELRFESTPGINNAKRWALDDFEFCVTEAPLSALLDGGTLWSGDKQFSDFSYHGGGDMPAAEDVFVKAITDADGNVGIRFQGAFVDAFGGGASDALIDYLVTAPEGKLIKDVHMSANPLVIGGGDKAGLVSITETFLPDNDQTVLSVFDIEPGSRKLTDWADLVDENGDLAPVQELHVQKDIIAWAQKLGSAATLSFIDQTFSQCDEDPMAPGRCRVMDHPHPGDFNGDGVVGTADYVVWRNGLGSTYTQADYEVWKANFESTWSIGVGSLSNAAVPEPSSLLLLVVSAAVRMFTRRANRR